MLGLIILFIFFIIILTLVGYLYYSSGTTAALAAPSVVQTSTLAPVPPALNEGMILAQDARTLVNGDNYLILQPDGNLVLYTPSGGILWSSGSYTRSPTNPYRLTMQPDGNAVIYDGNNSPIWSTGTSHTQGTAPFVWNLLPTSVNITDAKGKIIWDGK
jgi:hypothetical protein